MPLKSVFARQIFDSTGVPTIEIDLVTELGLFRASVPSGSTKGQHECLEKRDGDKKNYQGLGVSQVVTTINEQIAPELLKQNFEPTQQEEIDNFLILMDGTPNKSNLGVNAILGISMAVAKAGAAKRGLPLYKHIADMCGNTNIVLPVPVFNILNGGSFTSNKIVTQEIMIMPTGANSFAEAMKMGSEVYQYIKGVVVKKYGKDSTSAADCGGFVLTKVKKDKDALKLVKDAINKCKYAGRVEICIDSAASDYFKKGKYDLDFKNKKSKPSKWLKPEKLMKQYMDFIKNFQLASIEDPFHLEDWKSWVNITDKTTVQIVADQLTSVNPERIEAAAQKDACNCLLLKLNQIGTVIEAVKAHLTAKMNGWGTMVSHRRGDTEDTFIADFTVGISCGQIRAGAPCRSEGLSKYNQILRIEEELGSRARYAGRAFRNPT